MKVTFLNNPRLEPHGRDSGDWLVVEPFDVRVDIDGEPPVFITIPAGFTTDLASVPRIPGAYMLFGGRARRAAILHDYLYVKRWDRKFADNAFRAAMKTEGVNPVSRFFMWLGVRVGGSAYYDRHASSETAP